MNNLTDNLTNKLTDNLIKAIKQNDIDQVKIMLDNYNCGLGGIGDLNSLGSLGSLCSKSAFLHHAYKTNNLEIMELLIKSGANVDEKDDAGWTVLCNACVDGNYECVELLINYNTNLNLPIQIDTHIYTSVFIAYENEHLDIMKLLLENGADPNIQNGAYNTVLHWAAYDEDTCWMEILLEYGADSNIQNCFKDTVLHITTGNGFQDTVEMLLKYGVDPDIQNNDKETALHIATKKNYFDVVNLLLSYKANANIVNKQEMTPLDLAKTEKIKELLEIYQNDYILK